MERHQPPERPANVTEASRFTVRCRDCGRYFVTGPDRLCRPDGEERLVRPDGEGQYCRMCMGALEAEIYFDMVREHQGADNWN